MKRFFHKGFFGEMFRQLKVVGIVAAAILMVTNISAALTELPKILSQGSVTPTIPGGLELAFPMMSYIYITGLVFTFVAFNWLNRRSYSDFYHSLPVTRKQLYGSTVLAIFLWMVIGITAFALVRTMISLVFGTPFNYLLYLCVYINMLIGAIEVVGAVSLACAISGTRFVNFFASVVILFVPRFLLFVMSLFIEQQAGGMLEGVSYAFPLFDPSYNIIATPYVAVFSGVFNYFAPINYASVPAMLWSLVYSVLLVVLGGVAFNRRKSETAGIPTKSKVFQGAVRTAVGLPLLLFLMFLIDNNEADLVPAVVLVIFSFIFYCLYELISTKSPKKMAKSMPLWFICVGISLLYLVVPKVIIKAEQSVKISQENIKGWYLLSDDNYGLIDRLIGYGDKDYGRTVQENIEITDPRSIEIISNAYKRTVDMNNGIRDGGDYSWSWIKVRIDRKSGGDVVRNLYLTTVEERELMKLAKQNTAYAEADLAFPEGRKYYSIAELNMIESRELGRLYEEEYAGLSEADKLKLRNMNNSYYSYDDQYMFDTENPLRFSLSLKVCGCIGAKNYSSSYTVNSLTPRTLSKYVEIINSRNGEEVKAKLAELKSWFESGGSDDFPSYSVRIGDFAEIGYYDSQFMLGTMNGADVGLPKDEDPELYEMIRILANASLTTDPDEAVQVRVYLGWHENDFITRSSDMIFLKLSDEDIQRLIELYNLHTESMESKEYRY